MRVRRHSPGPRRGATAVEAALVLPVVVLLLVGVIALSTAVFRQHQVTYMAREGARWAAVHGAHYADASGTDATTPADVYAFMKSRGGSAGMNDDALSYSVVWNASQRPTRTVVEDDEVKDRANTVTVSVTYTWVNVPFFGTFTATGRSESTMSY